MTAFLFWNLNGKPLQGMVSDIAWHFDIDVIMLAECTVSPDLVLSALNANRSGYHYAPGFGCEKIEIFSRCSRKYILPVYEEDRLMVRHLKMPGAIDVLLAVTHFPSKLHWNDSSQSFACVELSHSIKRAEKQVGHTRTILVGDLNMNPFEDGLVSANGLNSVMSRDIASKRTRVIQSQEFPFFYNPMWNLFGDETPGPPGSYYYASSEHKVFFWNLFDQVLIRPDLLNLFETRDLIILQKSDNYSFVSERGLPDAKTASDHFPLVFKLAL